MNGMEIKNGIIIDGVLHEAVQDYVHCALCSLYENAQRWTTQHVCPICLAMAVLSIVAK